MEEVKAAAGSGSGLSIGFYDGRVHMCFGLLGVFFVFVLFGFGCFVIVCLLVHS